MLVLVLVNCMCIIWAEARQWREELGDSTSRLSIRDGYTGARRMVCIGVEKGFECKQWWIVDRYLGNEVQC